MLTRVATVMRSRRAIAAGIPVPGRDLRNRMREFFTSGSVGGAGGNPGPYPEADGLRLPLIGKDILQPGIEPAPPAGLAGGDFLAGEHRRRL